MAVKAAPLQSPGEPLAGSHLRQAAQEVNQRSKKDEGHKVPPKPATSHTRLLRCAVTLSALPPTQLPYQRTPQTHTCWGAPHCALRRLHCHHPSCPTPLPPYLLGCAALCAATSALPPPLLPRHRGSSRHLLGTLSTARVKISRLPSLRRGRGVRGGRMSEGEVWAKSPGGHMHPPPRHMHLPPGHMHPRQRLMICDPE